jgi:hypothetical protein
VVSQDTGFRRVTESDAAGTYQVSSLEPGSYKVTASKEGFKAFARFDVKVAAGASTRADFPLQVGSVFETITVRGTAPLLNESDASTGASFQAGDIARLPLNGGGLLDLIELVPGVNVVPATRGEAGQFTATGQRPNANYFTIDGASANTGIAAGGLPAQASGGTLPATSAFGSLDSLISLGAVEEVQAQTSTTVAQFGRMPGANIGVTSQSGSNQFHGETTYQIRNELLGANDWFANRAGLGQAPERLNEAMQTVGGPIQRDKMFFFLSYQRMGLREPFIDTQAVPTLDARLAAGAWSQAAVSLFPLPNQGALAPGVGQWTGGTDEPATLNAGSARVDRAVGSHVNFFGRYSDAPSTNQFGNVAVNQLDLRSQTLTLGLTVRPISRLTFEARVNESQTSVDSAWRDAAAGDSATCALEPLAFELSLNMYGLSCNTLVRFTIDGVGQLVSGSEGLYRQRQFQTVDTVALRLGRHSLEFGVDFRRVTAVRRAADETGVIADGATDLLNTSNLWKDQTPAVSQSTELTEYSLWAQDTWQVSSRLTVAAGLRWEFSPPPAYAGSINVYDPASGSVVSSNAPLWPTSYRDLAPRLGAAFRVTKDGRTVLRAGAGLYYDSSLSIATDILDGVGLTSSLLLSGVHAPFSFAFAYGFMPDLKLPQVRQWNVSLERAISAHDVVSLGYVGSNGRELIRREVGGPGTTPNYWFGLTTNHGFSNYQALQFQYRRRLASNLQATASYAWSHSIDNDSSDSALLWAGAGSSAANDVGSSDFDLRHSFTASVSYQFASGPLKRWRAEAIFRARSGFPITVLESEQYTGIAFMNSFRPDFLGGNPVWIADPSAPGGERLNPAAFATVASGVQGDLGRNSITGFGMSQVDAAIGREFRWRDRFSLDLRIDAFNALNHPNFGDPVRYMDSPLFGQSTSMLNLSLGTGSPGSGLAPLFESGGPRMLQGTIRFRF